MTTGLDTLTERERHTLRLILRGHDAKSAARELGLSVHTVNERLREARRKLGVTSSREAARRLLAQEGDGADATLETPPQNFADKPLGDAPERPLQADIAVSVTRRSAWFGLPPRSALILVGVTAMSLILAALFLPVSPLSVSGAPAVTKTAVGTEPEAGARSEAAAAARAADAFLALIDEGRWAESYAVTGVAFRRLNSLAVWTDVSERVRPPLGAVLTRDLAGNEYVPAPPEGYRLVKFRSTYANGTQQTESISLAWEDGAWKVTGIVFD
jgi:DNA-binding CsgD family transcriptional regulator